MSRTQVKSRLVFNFQGFEASTVEKLMGRVIYCAEKSSKLWGFSIDIKSQKNHPKDHFSECDLVNNGKDWQVDTRIIQFSFGDIVAPYLGALGVWRFLKSLPNFLAFFIDGTVFSYFKQSKLYGAFTLFPVIFMVFFASLSYVIASFLADLLNLSNQVQSTFIAVISVVLFFTFCRWPGEKLLFPLTMGHWEYARDMAVGANKNIDDRYDTFVDIVSRELANSKHDEVIFAGHSFGSVWAPMVLATVLERDPSLLEGRRITFLSMGGSLLNTALVPRAKFFREKISKLLKLKELFWHDYQCKDDPVCFYKSDMFVSLGLGKPEGGYQISRVNFKHSMDLERYRKMKKSIYDVHRQYGLYQDKCVSFDYYLRLLGPVFADELAKDPSKAKLITPKKDVIVQDAIILNN